MAWLEQLVVQVCLLITLGSCPCWGFFCMVCWACQGYSRLLITCLPCQWHILGTL